MTARHARGILAVAGICSVTSLLHAQTALQIVTDSLPNGTVGTAYNQPIDTSGGTCSTIGSASSTIDDGALPPGLFVASGTSVKQWSLAGTPSVAGTYRFTVHVRWTLTRTSPFQQPCVDEATKTLTMSVDAIQTLTADRPADYDHLSHRHFSACRRRRKGVLHGRLRHHRRAIGHRFGRPVVERDIAIHHHSRGPQHRLFDRRPRARDIRRPRHRDFRQRARVGYPGHARGSAG